MTPNQINAIRESWANVVPLGTEAGALFYTRLFEIDPSLRDLFQSTDFDAQNRKLIDVLSLAVSHLDDPEALVPALTELGARHDGYGVTPTHYDLVGQALLDTLQSALGDTWSDDLRDAWATLYGFVSAHMIAGGTARRAA